MLCYRVHKRDDTVLYKECCRRAGEAATSTSDSGKDQGETKSAAVVKRFVHVCLFIISDPSLYFSSTNFFLELHKRATYASLLLSIWGGGI